MVLPCSRWLVASLLVLGVGCGTGFNKSPVVSEGPEASVSETVSGTEVRLHLVVTDAEGDPLTFQWLQDPVDPGGTFSDTTVMEPSWVAPPVSSTKSFVLKVYIRDNESTLLGLTTVTVHPKQ